MSATSIEWSTHVWNPTAGCDRVSPGCDHCYAMTMAKRLKGMGQAKYQADGDPRTSGPGFLAHEWPDALDWPLTVKKPMRVFVNSMSDLFHDRISDEYIARVFAVMALAPQHTFQVLTKRHARMRSLLSDEDFQGNLAQTVVGWTVEMGIDLPEHLVMPERPSWYPLRNVWLGVSVENQQWADIRIPALLDTPAAVRFLSCEPLLAPVDFSRGLASALLGSQHVDWVIVGGESGPGARPMHPDWARSLRDQCAAAGVPFLFKQWGEWAPAGYAIRAGLPGDVEMRRNQYRPAEHYFPGSPDPRFTHTVVRRVGKKAAGRELGGRTWDQYPPAVSA